MTTTGAHYDTLGVDAGAESEAVRRAYRRLAMKAHPDKGGDPDEFRRIQEAYDVLSDPARRADYDRYGDAGPPPAGVDLMSQMFGGFGFGGAPGRGRRSDRVHNLSISMLEAYRGAHKTMRVSVRGTCMGCLKPCDACRGSGYAVMQLGPMLVQQQCGSCLGSKFGPSGGCAACEGGATTATRDVTIDLPPGVSDGHAVTIPGLGDQATAPGESAGNLIFAVRIEPHPDFARRGDDLVWKTATMSFEASVNGGTLRAPHFDGPLDVPTADWGVVDPRLEYVVPGKGFPGGDLVVKVDVRYPAVTARYTVRPAV